MALSTADRLRPPTLGLRSELVEAAWNHGYRSERGEADGWLYFASDIGVPGEIGLAVAAKGATWFLAVEHAGVAAELTAEPALPIPAGKRAAFRFASSSMLREALHRAYDLARSLPSAPLAEFEAEVASLGATEAEGLVRRRIGQDIFRRALMRYWDGRCPLTGITEPALLRASHIVPWAECLSDAERLNVHNGLLLAAHWDAAFDSGLVSFGDTGEAQFSPALGEAALKALRADMTMPLPLTIEHRNRLARHRQRYGY